MVSFMLLLLYTLAKSPWHTVDRRLGGSCAGVDNVVHSALNRCIDSATVAFVKTIHTIKRA
jgi:hypothetical protein